ncbi:MAG: hypothetical protein E6R11_02430 [Rhodocyclaceae bacterium]|nr:MAG: hypothetical protein E6R11_02430 [Rhodocyclaceae bacterium]
MSDDDLASLRITTELLRGGRAVSVLSGAMTVAALVLSVLAGWAAQSGWALLLAGVAGVGLCQAYFAFRVQLDAALLDALCAGRELDAQAMACFDQAMQGLGLLPAQKAGRAWSLRCRGAMRLLRVQVGLAIAQAVMWLAGVVAMPIS